MGMVIRILVICCVAFCAHAQNGMIPMPIGTGNASGSGGYTPPVAGYVAYYDASVASSITIGAIGVSRWADLSSNGHDLLQATSTLQPAYTGTGTGSAVVLSTTTGSTTHTLITGAFTLSQPYTIIIVFQNTTLVTASWVYDGLSPGNNMSLYNDPSLGLLMYAGSNGPAISPSPATGAFGVDVAVFNTSSSTQSWQDGTKQTGSVGSANGGGIQLGRGGTGMNYSNIQVKWIAIYPSALSAANQTTIVSGLRAYWGI